MFKMIRGPFAALLMILVASTALAFTPDDVELGRQLRVRYGALTSWRAEVAFPEYPRVAVNIWWSKGDWRQEWVENGTTFTAVGSGASVTASCPASFPLSPLLVFMPVGPVDAWKGWGVDNATRGYGFCDGAPCFIMGADPTNQTLPMIQLDNETFAPLLLRFGRTNPVEISFADFVVSKGFALPGSGRIVQGGRRLAFTVKWTDLLVPVEPGLFDGSALGGSLCIEPSQPFGLLRDILRIPLQ